MPRREEEFGWQLLNLPGHSCQGGEEAALGSALPAAGSASFRREAHAPSPLGLAAPSALPSPAFLAAERGTFKAGVEEAPPPKVASSLVVGALSWDVGDVGLGPSG